MTNEPACGISPTMPETPILRLFREHRLLMERARTYVTDSTGEVEDEELDRLFYDRADEIETRLMAEPCTCPADLAAKVIVSTVEGACVLDYDSDPMWVEVRGLVGV